MIELEMEIFMVNKFGYKIQGLVLEYEQLVKLICYLDCGKLPHVIT